jgi:hypothetical protein
MEAKLCVYPIIFPPFLLLTDPRKTLKVADLKEVCSRANIPTTTRSTKADLITKILASQPAMNAYNAKYQQNGNAAPSSNPAAQSTNDDIVSRNALLSTRRTYIRPQLAPPEECVFANSLRPPFSYTRPESTGHCKSPPHPFPYRLPHPRLLKPTPQIPPQSRLPLLPYDSLCSSIRLSLSCLDQASVKGDPPEDNSWCK